MKRQLDALEGKLDEARAAVSDQSKRLRHVEEALQATAVRCSGKRGTFSVIHASTTNLVPGLLRQTP